MEEKGRRGEEKEGMVSVREGRERKAMDENGKEKTEGQGKEG